MRVAQMVEHPMRIALIDGNNLAYKSYSAFKESRGGLLTNSVGIPTTVIFSLLNTFDNLTKNIQFDRIVLFWDITGSYYRKSLFKFYKKHRKYIDMKDYFEELDSAREHFDRMGVNQIIIKGFEADDLIGYLSHRLRDMGHKIVVVSDDKDFYQIVRPRIKIWRPIKDQFVTYDDLIDEFNLKPHELVRLKAIVGEDTDLIPGVCDLDEKNLKLIKCGLGQANAIKILKGKKNLTEAIDTWQDAPKTKRPWKQRLLDKKEQILLSYKLARIRIRLNQYKKWEQKFLVGIEDKAIAEKNPKLRTIVRLKNYLEIEKINVVFILRKLGIKLQ